MLQRRRVAAGFAEDAERRGQPHPGSQRRLEHLDKNAADIARNPFTEDADQERASQVRLDGAFGHHAAILHIERAPVIAVAPVCIGDLDGFGVARPTIGMNCKNRVPTSSQKNR